MTETESWFGEERIDTDARALNNVTDVTIQGEIQHLYPCAV